MFTWSLIKRQVNNSTNTLSITDQRVTGSGAYSDGFELSQKVTDITVAINLITYYWVNGQSLPIIETNFEECTTINFTMLNLATQIAPLINTKRIPHVESVLLMYEKGYWH